MLLLLLLPFILSLLPPLPLCEISPGGLTITVWVANQPTHGIAWPPEARQNWLQFQIPSFAPLSLSCCICETGMVMLISESHCEIMWVKSPAWCLALGSCRRNSLPCLLPTLSLATCLSPKQNWFPNWFYFFNRKSFACLKTLANSDWVGDFWEELHKSMQPVFIWFVDIL